MSGPRTSDALRNLVIFIIVLAVIAMIIALVVYFAVELPAQQALLHNPVLNFGKRDP